MSERDTARPLSFTRARRRPCPLTLVAVPVSMKLTAPTAPCKWRPDWALPGGPQLQEVWQVEEGGAAARQDGLLTGTSETLEVGRRLPRALSRPPENHLPLKL